MKLLVKKRVLGLVVVVFQLLFWKRYATTLPASSEENYAWQPHETAHQSRSATTSSSSSSSGSPRMLIGVISHNINYMGLKYRRRHRWLFELWNDTRWCSLNDYISTPEIEQSPCQVVYSFILGAHNSTSNIPPYHLGETDRPLTVTDVPLKSYKDTLEPHDDMTFLNIRENMNEGKTPTFFYWALQIAQKYNIPFIVKCDSDAFMRWGVLHGYLEHQIPSTSTPSGVVLGHFRHTAFWKDQSTVETFHWKQEWYQGMHLYLAGQLYLLGTDVAEAMIEEAQRWYTPNNQNITFAGPYFAGHEDHDALSMAQIAYHEKYQSQQKPLRWLSLAKSISFWEHPVKGDYRWKRIITREERMARERLEQQQLGKSQESGPFEVTRVVSSHVKPSLLVILMELPPTSQTYQEHQNDYINKWKQKSSMLIPENAICKFSKYPNGATCELFYVFAAPAPATAGAIADENLWLLDVVVDDSSSLGIAVLKHISFSLREIIKRLDYVLLIQQNVWLHASRWRIMAKNQPVLGHRVVIGQMRDKYQTVREFKDHGKEHLFYKEFDNIHLYLGSDCLGISTPFVADIVARMAWNETPTERAEGHLGHDLTLWAHRVPKTILHWVTITKSLEFWETFKE